MRVRDAPGGGRVVEVAPERLARWLDGFAERNGGVLATSAVPREVALTAATGAVALAAVPFPPLPADALGEAEGAWTAPLLAHAQRERTVGLLLVRLGGHSVGVAEGASVVASRTGRRLVHGRSAAGGTAQRRFARRREGQAREALRAAADDAVEVLGDRLPGLDAVVLGGDRAALRQLGRDTRLAGVLALADQRVLDVAEPRRAVLDEAARRCRAVQITVRDG